MKPPIIKIEKNKRDISYVSLSDLQKEMAKHNNLPYSSRFSFIPFIYKMNERVQHFNCEMTASMIPGIEALEEKIRLQNGAVDNELQSEVDEITNMLLPSMFLEGEQSFICPPFKKEFIYATPAMQVFQNADEWQVKIDNALWDKKIISPVQKTAIFLLNKFYDQDLHSIIGDVITLKNIKNNREIHFKMTLRTDFIDVELAEPLKALTKRDITDLLNNLDVDEKVLHYLPPENFIFKGFGIGVFTDVTTFEVQSQLKNATVQVANIKPQEFLVTLKKQLHDFLKRSDIEVGFADLFFDKNADRTNYSLSGKRDFETTCQIKKFDHHSEDLYLKALTSKEIVIADNLQKSENPSISEKALIDVGYNSLMLIPLEDEKGDVNAIIEFGSKQKYAFNFYDVKRLEPFIELLKLGNDAFVNDFKNKINAYVKNQFTSIHPSVEWKFEEVATKYQIKKESGIANYELEDIVFENVYPLYAQADIVNSSNLRNVAIQKDLVENLELLIDLLQVLSKEVRFHLLESYLLKAENALQSINKEYSSSSESYILDLLTMQIHPFLRQLNVQFKTLPQQELKTYFDMLNSEVGILYKHRKAYEISVNKVNTCISNFIVAEDEKMQINLPHYFQKYKTDGIEYNIYLGQAILNNQKFSKFHLKDFRLWQLVNLCEITRKVKDIESELPIPLTTAQLIFVYSTPLSIRFRMDEKQFDVDGSYNVRYEILKKRIDKAYIKDSNERLSQTNKIAIVYLLDKDKQEYLDYLDYLVSKGFIKDKIEDLELEKLQGADGLKALRVEVVHQ